MAIEVEKEFEVDQAPEEVWAFLVDPERVAECLPGGEVTDRIDDRTWEGGIGVELGPFGVSFTGRMRFDRLDEENLEVEMSGSGTDEKGKGSVSMRMHSRLERLDGGGTRVAVRQKLELEGPIASVGRGGIVQNVADVMFGRFTRCVTKKLAGG